MLKCWNAEGKSSKIPIVARLQSEEVSYYTQNKYRITFIYINCITTFILWHWLDVNAYLWMHLWIHCWLNDGGSDDSLQNKIDDTFYPFYVFVFASCVVYTLRCFYHYLVELTQFLAQHFLIMNNHLLQVYFVSTATTYKDSFWVLNRPRIRCVF